MCSDSIAARHISYKWLKGDGRRVLCNWGNVAGYQDSNS